MSEDKISKKAKGIMDGLMDDEDNSKKVKEEKKESSKEEKMKRSFTLTSEQVEKLYMLKAKNSEMTLSAIVGEAIESYYEEGE